MQFRLRTLLIVTALLPPLAAGVWFLSRSAQGQVILFLTAVMSIYFIASFWLRPRIGPPSE